AVTGSNSFESRGWRWGGAGSRGLRRLWLGVSKRTAPIIASSIFLSRGLPTWFIFNPIKGSNLTGNRHGLRASGRTEAAQEYGEDVRRPGAHSGRNERHGRSGDASGGSRRSRTQGEGPRSLAARRAHRVWRSRPQPLGDGCGLGGDLAHRRSASARTGRVWPRSATGVVHA